MDVATLVVHPRDASTDFLEPLYAALPDATVVREATSRAELLQLLAIHQRVLLMGHGSPRGLFDLDGAMGDGPLFVVDKTCVDLLRDKASSSIFLWCHADEFVLQHDLHGFYSGMFVSEKQEADGEGLLGVTEDDVTASNTCFVQCLARAVMLSEDEMYEAVCNGPYRELAATNPVAAYNIERLFRRK